MERPQPQRTSGKSGRAEGVNHLESGEERFQNSLMSCLEKDSGRREGEGKELAST